jgi:hypothetical protein
MVGLGWAVAYRNYSTRYVAAEELAKRRQGRSRRLPNGGSSLPRRKGESGSARDAAAMDNSLLPPSLKINRKLSLPSGFG